MYNNLLLSIIIELSIVIVVFYFGMRPPVDWKIADKSPKNYMITICRSILIIVGLYCCLSIILYPLMMRLYKRWMIYA